MEKYNLYQRIEDYLDNKLSDKDKAAFQEELKKDKDLQAEVNLHRTLQEDFSEDVLTLKKKLQDVKKESKTVEKPKTKIINLVLRYASIAAIIVLGIVFIPGILPSDLNPDELYGEHFDQYAMALNQRSTGLEENNQKLNSAIQNYIDGDFINAAKNFQSIYELEKNDLYLLYSANAYQAIENFDEAIPIYDKIIDNSNPQVIQQAQWYKSLSLIKSGNIEEAKTLLISLGEDHYKAESIKKILRSLK